MPNPARVDPKDRTLLWRKVHMRLSQLGLPPAHLIDALGCTGARHKAWLRIGKDLNKPWTVKEERRRLYEVALALPSGSLCDAIPVALVALCPVPPALGAAPALGPRARDMAPDGALHATAMHLEIGAQALPVLHTYLGLVTPGGIP